MKNNYLISGIPITDTDQGKVVLDISLEDVKFSEDHSDIIAGKVTAQATGYSNDEEINPIVLEGSDVSLTGAGGIPSANVTIIPKLNNVDVPGTISSVNLTIVDTQLGDYYLQGGSFDYTDEQAAMPIKVPIASKLQQIALSTDLEGVYVWTATEPINITGDATFDGGLITITGDCTITIPVVED